MLQQAHAAPSCPLVTGAHSVPRARAAQAHGAPPPLSFSALLSFAPCREQFERTLIVADDGAYVSYLEGCTAPAFDENQLHAAVVELSAGAGAEIKYSTVQNW